MDYVEYLRNDSGWARRFTRMLCEIHIPLAEKVADILDVTGVERVMDLGGNSGVVSMALARRHPHLSMTVVDLPHVCAAGREIVAENSLADRITHHPADFLQDDLPGGYDLVMYCDVSVYDENLFRKVWKALKPGGRFVFVDRFAEAENIPAGLYWVFQDSLVNPDLKCTPLPVLFTLLEQAGFRVSPDEVIEIGRSRMFAAYRD